MTLYGVTYSNVESYSGPPTRLVAVFPTLREAYIYARDQRGYGLGIDWNLCEVVVGEPIDVHTRLITSVPHRGYHLNDIPLWEFELLYGA